MRKMATNRIHFVDRSLSLKKLEKDYGCFILSCRHRDILRCSKSRHFRSCYASNGVCSNVPFQLCHYPEYAIIGKKDKSGDWLWRAFVRLTYEAWDSRKDVLIIHKIYGNPPDRVMDCIEVNLTGVYTRVRFVNYDAS